MHFLPQECCQSLKERRIQSISDLHREAELQWHLGVQQQLRLCNSSLSASIAGLCPNLIDSMIQPILVSALIYSMSQPFSLCSTSISENCQVLCRRGLQTPMTAPKIQFGESSPKHRPLYRELWQPSVPLRMLCALCQELVLEVSVE